MAKVTAAASMQFRGASIGAQEIAEFLANVPTTSKITINVAKGDPRDPREAGFRETSLKAEWEMGGD